MCYDTKYRNNDRNWLQNLLITIAYLFYYSITNIIIKFLIFSRNFWFIFGRTFGRTFGQLGRNFGFGRNWFWPFRSFTTWKLIELSYFLTKHKGWVWTIFSLKRTMLLIKEIRKNSCKLNQNFHKTSIAIES